MPVPQLGEVIDSFGTSIVEIDGTGKMPVPQLGEIVDIFGTSIVSTTSTETASTISVFSGIIKL